MITVVIPIASQPARVVGQNQGHICATGTALDGNNTQPVEVRAKVYSLQSLPNPLPAEPPQDAVQAVLQAQNWSCANVPGAACGANPNSCPNNLAVWARYGSNQLFETNVTPFTGMASEITDCQANNSNNRGGNNTN